MEKTPDGVGATLGATQQGLDRAPPGGEQRRHLLVFTGSASWLYQLPVEGRVVIGRSETADLRLDDGSVSRAHAALEITADTITLCDLGSQNGTFVNNTRVDGKLALHPNDVVTIQKSTLILHAVAAANIAAASILALPELRERLVDEIDRAVRYERSVSLLCLAFDAGVDPRSLERTVASQLRRIDSVAWSGSALYVLLAEAAADEAVQIATRVRGRLGTTAVRIGYATCPTDGYEVDMLVASAHNAATGAEANTIEGSTRAYQTLTVGTQRVIVADPAVVRMYALIERLAPVDIPVLVMGETGAGKELAASALHFHSRRAARDMVSLNCAAIQETLVESELFGHEKGAFSGAVATKVGLIEAASGSTLFLDEVGELSPTVQAKLLRVLELGRMTRVGDVREREVDVRIVAATNRDLHDEVDSGRFRQDLFFRLSGATLHIPPLRDRPRELPLLATAFLTDACRRTNRSVMVIADAAMAALLAYRWPGNVRELRNLMSYVAAAHPEDVLTETHVTERLAQARPVPGARREGTPVPGAFRPIADEIRDLEMLRIREALDATSGNQTRAAALLAMPVRTFYEKAKQYGLTPKKKS